MEEFHANRGILPLRTFSIERFSYDQLVHLKLGLIRTESNSLILTLRCEYRENEIEK